jgi:hypothetical protein
MKEKIGIFLNVDEWQIIVDYLTNSDKKDDFEIENKIRGQFFENKHYLDINRNRPYVPRT